MKKVFMAVYSSVEYYPPTLNALACLQTKFDNLFILSRNVLKLSWTYSPNIQNIQSGKFTPIREAEKKSTLWKIMSFVLYTWNMWKTIRTQKPDLVILYDNIPTLSYYLVQFFIGYKPFLWYHNHDVVDKKTTTKYTITWFAIMAEQRIFRYLDAFSLPSEDRKQYFPLETLKGKYYFIPNMPAKSFYGAYYTPKVIEDANIHIVYQGSLAKGQGFEELIKLVSSNKCTKKIYFTIKSFYSYQQYNTELQQEIEKCHLEEQIKLLDTSPYKEMPLFTKKHHIGLAIFSEQSIIRNTAGTSSNKIYEYIAVGLPVILFDNEHFRKYLGKYSWAFFTDLSEKSLMDCIEKIIANYETLSQQANKDFMAELNFETYFVPALDEIMKKIS
jgi:glycosyltransferase involved in cell wall biosynthesis